MQNPTEEATLDQVFYFFRSWTNFRDVKSGQAVAKLTGKSKAPLKALFYIFDWR